MDGMVSARPAEEGSRTANLNLGCEEIRVTNGSELRGLYGVKYLDKQT